MRQRRDKAGQPNPAADDDHRGIPRDEHGVPVLFVLPPAMRARYDEKLARCEAAWREGEPLAIAEAATLSSLHRQPIPKWLEQAIIELAAKRRTPAQAKRCEEARKDWIRYTVVRDLKLGIPGIYKPIAKLSWDDAYAEASRVLQGTPAAGEESTMKRAYAAVRGDLGKGRHGKYFPLKDKRAAGHHARQMQDRRRRKSRATRKVRRFA
jgi:hypothetical protein